MALPADHPLCQMTVEMRKARDGIEELEHAHAQFKRTLRRTEFPSRADARKAWAMLYEQRRVLQALVDQFEEALAQLDTIYQEAWEAQKRVWVDSLDADLAQLGRDARE
jgi:hypothetical protein